MFQSKQLIMHSEGHVGKSASSAQIYQSLTTGGDADAQVDPKIIDNRDDRIDDPDDGQLLIRHGSVRHAVKRAAR